MTAWMTLAQQQAARERDRARDAAVALEQENARLRDGLDALVAALREGVAKADRELTDLAQAPTSQYVQPRMDRLDGQVGVMNWALGQVTALLLRVDGAE